MDCIGTRRVLARRRVDDARPAGDAEPQRRRVTRDRSRALDARERRARRVAGAAGEDVLQTATRRIGLPIEEQRSAHGDVARDRVETLRVQSAQDEQRALVDEEGIAAALDDELPRDTAVAQRAVTAERRREPIRRPEAGEQRERRSQTFVTDAG